MIHVITAMTILAIVHICSFAAMTEPRYSVKKTAAIYALFYVLFIGLAVTSSLLVENYADLVFVSFTSAIFIAFFIFAATSADPFCKKAFLFISYVNIYCIFQIIIIVFEELWFSDIGWIGQIYLRNIMRSLMFLPMIWIYIRYLRPAIREVSNTEKKTWRSIFLVSLLFLAAFATIQVITSADVSREKTIFLLFILITAVYGSVMWLIFGIVRYMSRQSKVELISRNVEYLQSQLALERENERIAKTIRHDYRHHNRNIAAMLKKGETEDAIRYIEKYDESLISVKPKKICPNITVNAILSSFCSRAETEGFSVSVFADTREKSDIEDMDFVAVLSNLLENAVNGCREYGSGGEINVNIRTVLGKTVIVCSNSCKPGLAIENSMLKQKGIGIDSIILAAKKYDGDINYSYENGILTACIILKA